MSLHGQIMSLPAGQGTQSQRPDMAYKLGHGDARHAAAELAQKADACIEVLRAIVQQQSTMGFDGSPSDELMDVARSALAAVG